MRTFLLLLLFNITYAQDRMNIDWGFVGVPSNAVLLNSSGSNKTTVQDWLKVINPPEPETSIQKQEACLRKTLLNNVTFPETLITFKEDGTFSDILLFNKDITDLEILFVGVKYSLDALYGESENIAYDKGVIGWVWKGEEFQLSLTRVDNAIGILYKRKP